VNPNFLELNTEIFFNRAWMKLGKAIPGKLNILPKDSLFLEKLKNDYQDMQMMMLGDVPSFDSVIDDIQKLEEKMSLQPTQ